MGFAAGTLVEARGREWVVLPDSEEDFLVLRPLGGSDDDISGVFAEEARPASFPPPQVDDLGDQSSAAMLRAALRIGFRSSAGPFRSLAGIAVEPRSYQLVPLLLALGDTVMVFGVFAAAFVVAALAAFTLPERRGVALEDT